ncbi:MAG: ammonium transporter [Gammaproteobacteria bacterium]|nr:MAG: ammonium transporter [Gammaproteobacteria bacterium]
MEDLVQTNYALDTFYFLICGVLVMFMAPGFAMLEAGLVRAKNTAEILTKNVGLFAIAVVMYMLVGYYLMYMGISEGGYFPSFGFLIGGENSVAETLASDGDIYYSNRSDHFFQVVFVATAMSIVSGAVAERMKLWAFLAFAVVMTGFIYPIQGAWSWGEGWLDAAGYSDYAGSGIVHMCGAAAALAGVLVLGPRAGKYGPDGSSRAIPGANLPLATLGVFILWFGWFGFNGGSELIVSNIDSANAVAAVFVNTNLAAAGGVIGALLLARIMMGKADLTLTLNGALAGLVSITANPLDPSPLVATIIGVLGGIIVVLSIIGLDKIKIDDPVGAISVHGTCGIFGVLAVVVTGGAAVGAQLLGLAAIFIWTFALSFIVWTVLKMVMGIRVSEEEEYEGVDLSECGLEAYPEFVKSA